MRILDALACVAIAIAVLLLAACGPSPMFDCEKEFRSRVTSSPTQQTAAVLSVRCGASTPDASWVLLANPGEEFDLEHDLVAVFEGVDVNIAWDESVLDVTFGAAKPYRTEISAKGTEIRYRKVQFLRQDLDE